MNKSISGRVPWLICTAAAALIAAVLRKWQLGSAFEEGTGLATPWAPASVTLLCVMVMAGAWFIILGIYQPVAKQSEADEQAIRWDLVFLGTGSPVYPVLVVLAALLVVASIPVLFIVGVDQWQIYQEAVAAKMHNSSVQLPSNNGMLTLITAAGAFLAALGLLLMARDGLRPGRRGKGGFAAALPGVAGCIWLMESFRAHAANPVRWDYVPQILAIVLGMAFYMDLAGMSAGSPRPRRLLWMAGMTAILSAVSLVSTMTELSILAAVQEPILSTQLGDLFLLLAQILTAVGVLWQLPPCLKNPPQSTAALIPQPEEASIQEETTDE